VSDVQTAAADRIKAAVADRNPASFVEVSAQDLATLTAAVPAGKETSLVWGRGPQNALAGRPAAEQARIKIHVLVRDVADLLGALGVNAQ
jgi:hypothetical protein